MARQGMLTMGQLGLIVAMRLVFNATFRIVYPLLPFLANRFEVSATTVNLLVTVQVGSGLLSLVGGTLADRVGGRTTMALGIGGYVAGSLICGLSTSFGAFLLGYVFLGLGTTLYLPALQSYVSHQTPYSQRGRVMGMLELPWALAGIVGVPLLTWLVKLRGDVGLVYLLLALGSLLALGATLTLLPNDRSGGAAWRAVTSPWKLLGRPTVRAITLFCGLMLGAQELMFIVQSAWQEHYFGLDTAARGQLFSLFGVAELAASTGVALLADRLGLRRAVLIGATATALSYLALPGLLASAALYAAGLFGLMLCFEFTLVASLPLIAEIVPEARGTTIALSRTGADIGKVTGSLLSAPLWMAFGPLANGALAAGALLAGAALLLRFVTESPLQQPDVEPGLE